jgi:glutathione S-transferase
MYHTFMLPEPDRVPGLKAAALQQVQAPLLVLEGALAKGGGFVMGGRFTVADLNLACCVFYLRMNPEALLDKPAVREWYAAALARPAAKAAFALRGD